MQHNNCQYHFMLISLFLFCLQTTTSCSNREWRRPRLASLSWNRSQTAQSLRIPPKAAKQDSIFWRYVRQRATRAFTCMPRRRPIRIGFIRSCRVTLSSPWCRWLVTACRSCGSQAPRRRYTASQCNTAWPLTRKKTSSRSVPPWHTYTAMSRRRCRHTPGSASRGRRPEMTSHNGHLPWNPFKSRRLGIGASAERLRLRSCAVNPAIGISSTCSPFTRRRTWVARTTAAARERRCTRGTRSWGRTDRGGTTWNASRWNGRSCTTWRKKRRRWCSRYNRVRPGC